MSDLALHDRRQTDVGLAIVQTKLDGHLDDCVKAHALTNSRLSRIEVGIVVGLLTLLGGGAATIGLLLRILFHVG